MDVELSWKRLKQNLVLADQYANGIQPGPFLPADLRAQIALSHAAVAQAYAAAIETAGRQSVQNVITRSGEDRAS